MRVMLPVDVHMSMIYGCADVFYQAAHPGAAERGYIDNENAL